MIWALIMAIMAAVLPPTDSKQCDDGEMIPLLKRHDGFERSSLTVDRLDDLEEVIKVQRARPRFS